MVQGRNNLIYGPGARVNCIPVRSTEPDAGAVAVMVIVISPELPWEILAEVTLMVTPVNPTGIPVILLTTQLVIVLEPISVALNFVVPVL